MTAINCISENKTSLRRKKIVNETLDLLERKMHRTFTSYLTLVNLGTVAEEKEADKQRKKQARAKSARLLKKLPKETSNVQREERIRQLLTEDKQRRQVIKIQKELQWCLTQPYLGV